MIPYGRQDIDENDVQAVMEALRSDWLTQGPAIPRFEAAIAEACGGAQAVAMANATCALHVAYKALGIGPGKLVWTSPNTFVATANAALYLGAAVDFVDIDEESQNLCPNKLERKLESAKAAGKPLPDLVVPVHFAGRSCDMEPIHSLSRKFGFRIVEDASHSVGGTHRGQPIGSCQFSDMVVFSFHPVKIVTSAEGGMVLTRSPELAAASRLLRTHGITRDIAILTRPEEGPWYYEQHDLGFNYRLTDLQAALGASQVRRLSQFNERRVELVRRYREALAGETLLRCPSDDPHGRSGWHLFAVNFQGDRHEQLRRDAFAHLKADDIHPNVHYIPVPMQPYYRKLGFRPEDFPAALTHYRSALSLPLYFGLTDKQQDKVIDSLRRFLRAAG